MFMAPVLPLSAVVGVRMTNNQSIFRNVVMLEAGQTVFHKSDKGNQCQDNNMCETLLHLLVYAAKLRAILKKSNPHKWLFSHEPAPKKTDSNPKINYHL